ncbi:hypothetical protein ABTM54_19340, partial [Acinetobacter baumannii]
EWTSFDWRAGVIAALAAWLVIGRKAPVPAVLAGAALAGLVLAGQVLAPRCASALALRLRPTARSRRPRSPAAD